MPWSVLRGSLRPGREALPGVRAEGEHRARPVLGIADADGAIAMAASTHSPPMLL